MNGVTFVKAYTNTYWVTFESGQSGCIETHPKEDPRTVAAAHGIPRTIEPLPYPARPMLRRVTECPEFCYSPTTCKGRTACPKSYACSD
jgi:hypothetical protein